MKRFKFRKPLVASDLTPTNIHVLWVKPKADGTIDDIQEWKGSWQSIVNKETITETVTVTETVEVPAEINLQTLANISPTDIESELSASEDAEVLSNIKTGFEYSVSVIDTRLGELSSTELSEE